MAELLVNSTDNDAKYELIVAGNKGLLVNLDITTLITSHFNTAQAIPVKESVNILRNQREEY